MNIYKCKTPGCGELSLDNSKRCELCGKKNWEETDPTIMTPDDWKEYFELADKPEDELFAVKKWAEGGSLESIKTLAYMYDTGRGCKPDMNASMKWWEKAAARGDPEAICSLGVKYIETGKDIPKGISLLWKARDLKNPLAPCFLGIMYSVGAFVPQNEKKAEKLFKQSAERGESIGMVYYAESILNNSKNRDDIEKGIYWLWRAARDDNPEAQLSLGRLLSDEDTELYDLTQADFWLRRALDNEHNGAASALAEIWMDAYVDGFRDDATTQEMLTILTDALKRGDYMAAKTLGDIYRDGIGVEQDYERAYKYYRQGQGTNLYCSTGVAQCFRHGWGVQKNESLSAKILSDVLEEGREKGNVIPTTAVLEYADMREHGIGMTKNADEAFELYSMVANAGNPKAIGYIGKCILERHPNVEGSDEDAMSMLVVAAMNDDYDSALYLANLLYKKGDIEGAMIHIKTALDLEPWEHSNKATEFARQYFPDMLNNYPVPAVAPT